MKRMLFAAALALTLGTLVWAQGAKPNFSGTWTLDPAKTDFGPMPPPESMVLVIDHKDPEMKISSTQKTEQGQFDNERRITTDGRENTNKLRTMMGEQEVKSKTSWNGSKLTTMFKLDVQGNAVEVTDSWELSDDGKTMTLARHATSAQGDFDQKMVFNKK